MQEPIGLRHHALGHSVITQLAPPTPDGRGITSARSRCPIHGSMWLRSKPRYSSALRTLNPAPRSTGPCTPPAARARQADRTSHLVRYLSRSRTGTSRQSLPCECRRRGGGGMLAQPPAHLGIGGISVDVMRYPTDRGLAGREVTPGPPVTAAPGQMPATPAAGPRPSPPLPGSCRSRPAPRTRSPPAPRQSGDVPRVACVDQAPHPACALRQRLHPMPHRAPRLPGEGHP